MSKKPDFINLDNSVRFYVGHVSDEKILGPYYQDCSSAISNFDRRQFGDFDADGLPMCGFGDDAFYNVIYIVQFGLLHFDFYCKSGNKTDIDLFMKCADWIVANKTVFKDSYTWPSNDINYKYHLDKGWVSAMYQGQILSLLLRAYQHTGDDRYLQCAATAFNFFKYKVSEGGSVVIDEAGYMWMEEYPTDPPSFVLNGFIYTLFGLLDFYRVTGSAEADSYIQSVYKTLLNNIDRYDAGYWSYYDLLNRELVSVYYQRNIHVIQMEILYRLTGEKKYKDLADKWLRQCNPLNILFVKLMYRVWPRIRKQKARR